MKRKILIVEDNVGLSQIQKDWLSRAGYDAVTAMSEPIARSLIRKTQFDLILSDVRLPEGDGISLLEWLRKEKKDIPFILTTEYVSVPDVVRTIKLGAWDYLPKPVHRDYLLELAEDIFRYLSLLPCYYQFLYPLPYMHQFRIQIYRSAFCYPLWTYFLYL